MPLISQHQSSATTKLLLLADSGSGKTGALCSLAAAGYNLRILDCDNGMDVVRNLLLDPKSIYPKDSVERVHYITITEEMRVAGGKLIPSKADAWQRAMAKLHEWKDGDINLGGVLSWTSQDILVIDSLTAISRFAMTMTLGMNGRLGQKPHQADWGVAQDLVENLIQMLTSSYVKCNVIFNCHLMYMGGGMENLEKNPGLASLPMKGYPASLGKALSPKIGSYFNNALLIEVQGSGPNAKRKIFTNVRGVVALKNTAPLRVAPEYSLETGLADYFKALRQ